LRPAASIPAKARYARGGGSIGDERACQLVVQPSIERGHHAFVALLPPEPGHLRRREVGIERQPGEVGQSIALSGEAPGHRDRPPVLPAERRSQRTPGLPVPAEDRLSLVGKTHGLDPLPGRGKRFPARLDDRLEQLLRVLLHRTLRAGAGIDRSAALAEDLPIAGDHQRFRRGRALVDRQNVHDRQTYIPTQRVFERTPGVRDTVRTSRGEDTSSYRSHTGSPPSGLEMPVWAAEVVVDEELVRGLLTRFPELEVRSLRKLAEGWDNSLWVVDERYAFRFPRRAIAIPGVEREIAVLPTLAPLLPLPVPRPVFVSGPVEDYPWPFFGCELVPGVEAGDAALDDDARLAIALQLARFLRTLHSVDLGVPLPLDFNGRADMAKRTALAREELAELKRLGLWRAPQRVSRLLDEAERLPPPEQPVLVHGDLHFRHVLVEGRTVSGVIDWGDVCRADPAIDLPLLWSFVPPEARRVFLEAYGEVNEAQLLRARVLAFQLCAVLARYGRLEELEGVEREGLAGLNRTLVD
jgi:aminoglycoside phosphotransferase (APT) family kinase protein